jgi:hypothetical protein
MKKRFIESGQTKYAVIGSALFLATAMMPISWFTFANQLIALLQIKQTY